MKYNNFHVEKPEPNKLLYFFGPNGKDILGWYRDFGWLHFETVTGEFSGFVPKWWYYAENELAESIEDPRNPKPKVPGKRGRPAKIAEELPETKKSVNLINLEKNSKITVRKPGKSAETTDFF